MEYINPTITSINDLKQYFGHRSNLTWQEIEIFPVPLSEVAVSCCQTDYGKFANTDFFVSGNQTDTLTIVVGESWCYGGKQRDMKHDSTESPESFAKALTTTMGSQLAHYTRSDLRQNAFPGDNTSNIVRKVGNLLAEYADSDYTTINVCVQMSDVIREAGVYCSLEPDDHVLDMIDRGQQGDRWDSPEAWLKEYESGYLDKLESFRANHTGKQKVNITMWKNFTPWCLTKSERSQWQNICTIDDCWINYLSAQEGYPVNINLFNNPASVDRNCKDAVANVSDISDEVINDELARIERLHHYWENVSPHRAGLSVHYPSATAHADWALKITRESNWFKES